MKSHLLEHACAEPLFGRRHGVHLGKVAKVSFVCAPPYCFPAHVGREIDTTKAQSRNEDPRDVGPV